MAINLRKVMAVVVEPQLEAMGFKFDAELSDVFQIGYERRVGKAHEHLAFRSSIYRDSLEVSMSTNCETTGATLSELMGLEEFYWKFADEVELAAKLRDEMSRREAANN